jgi:hypothetical protein
MEINVHEEDVVDQPVQIGPASGLSAEEKAKMDAIFSGVEPAAVVPPVAEQAPAQEPEITADDLPKVEESKVEAGKKFRVKLPDGEVEVDESEVVNGYMRQSDYTRKTQELARLKAEAEAMREAMAYYQKPVEPVQPVYQQPTGEFEPQTPTEQVLYNELQAIKGQVGTLAQARDNDTRQSVYDKMDGEIKAFKDAHKDLTDEQFGMVLDDLNRFKALPSKEAFETIYKARFTDEQKIRDSERKEYTRVLLEKKKATLAPSTESGAPQPPPDVRQMSDGDRLAKMADSLR